MTRCEISNHISQESSGIIEKKITNLKQDELEERLTNIKVKNKYTALLLSIFLGGVGADRFYFGEIGFGIIKMVVHIGSLPFLLAMWYDGVWLLFLLPCLIWETIDIYTAVGKAESVNLRTIEKALTKVSLSEKTEMLKKKYDKHLPNEVGAEIWESVASQSEEIIDNLMLAPKKNKNLAILLAFFFGGIGLDSFYLKNNIMGIIRASVHIVAILLLLLGPDCLVGFTIIFVSVDLFLNLSNILSAGKTATALNKITI